MNLLTFKLVLDIIARGEHDTVYARPSAYAEQDFATAGPSQPRQRGGGSMTLRPRKAQC